MLLALDSTHEREQVGPGITDDPIATFAPRDGVVAGPTLDRVVTRSPEDRMALVGLVASETSSASIGKNPELDDRLSQWQKDRAEPAQRIKAGKMIHYE